MGQLMYLNSYLERTVFSSFQLQRKHTMQRCGVWALLVIFICYFINSSRSASIPQSKADQEQELLRLLERLDRLLTKPEPEEASFENDGPAPYKRDGGYKRMLGDGPAPYKRWGGMRGEVPYPD